MSDASTDLWRDIELNEALYQLEVDKKDFLINPTIKNAEGIRDKYIQIMGAKRGWRHMDLADSRKNISLFGEYIVGEISEEEIVNYIKSESSSYKVTITDFGGISGINLERAVVQAMGESMLEDLKGEKFVINIEKGKGQINIRYRPFSKEEAQREDNLISNYKKFIPEDKQ